MNRLGTFRTTGTIHMKIPSNSSKRFQEGLERFGFRKCLSEEQEKAIKIIFQGNLDVYLNLRAGGGKSLCFQLPTVLKADKVTVVFVPTHTLAKDQILFLKKNKINSKYLCPRTSTAELQELTRFRQTQASGDSKIQFIYVAVQNGGIINLVKDYLIHLNERNTLAYVVFDEAHCLSPLSHNYIPTYMDMANLVKEVCPNICKIALTGTATSEVRKDIRGRLNLQNACWIREMNYQMTVFYDVHFKDMLAKPFEDLKQFIEDPSGKIRIGGKKPATEHQKSGIIFCSTKQTARTVAEELTALDVPAVVYYGNLPLKEREAVHENWTEEKIPVIVTTHTFGIGLHKPNIRFVVHWNLPPSLLQMYQNDGRISQDGRRAYCRVYHDLNDEKTSMRSLNCRFKKPGHSDDAVAKQRQFFREVVDYCLSTECRHVARSRYFEERAPPCELHCDACRYKAELTVKIETHLQHRASENNPKTATEPSKPPRAYFYQQLRSELQKNYDQTRGEASQILTLTDIAEIARRLEKSLFTAERWKYLDGATQTLRSIKNCTNTRSLCGSLTAFTEEDIRTLRRKREDRKYRRSVKRSAPQKLIRTRATREALLDRYYSK